MLSFKGYHSGRTSSENRDPEVGTSSVDSMEQKEHVATLQWPSVWVSVALFRGLKRWEGLSLAQSPTWHWKIIGGFRAREWLSSTFLLPYNKHPLNVVSWHHDSIIFAQRPTVWAGLGESAHLCSSLHSWGNDKAGNGSHLKACSLTCLVGNVGFTRWPKLDCTKPFHRPSWLPHKMVAGFPRQAFQEREPGGSLYHFY